MKLVFIVLYIIVLATTNVVFGQLLNPSKGRIIKAQNPQEAHFTFCEFLTDSSRDIFQVRQITIVDSQFNSRPSYPLGLNIDSVGIQDLLPKFKEAKTYSAYQMSGIFRSYFLNSSRLKSEGLLELPNTFRKNKDTIFIRSIDEFYERDSLFAFAEKKFKDRILSSKIGMWREYYDNGQLKKAGVYAHINTKILREEVARNCHEIEVNRPFNVDEVFQTLPYGVWYEYDKLGKLIRKWTYSFDFKTGELSEILIPQ